MVIHYGVVKMCRIKMPDSDNTKINRRANGFLMSQCFQGNSKRNNLYSTVKGNRLRIHIVISRQNTKKR